MAMPTFTMRQLLESGVHYGHNTRRWNPKMAPYIFGERSEVHILDLQQTVPMLHKALEVARDTVKAGGRVLFVGTKVQGSDIVKESANRCGQYYINHRWLGGLLTNWKTVNQSIKHLKEMIDELEKRGSTHVSIDFNCDHDEYELSGYSYLQLSTQELEEIEHKKLTDLEKIEKIRILERQIQDIQNGKS